MIPSAAISQISKMILLKYARQSIATGLKDRVPGKVPAIDLPSDLIIPGASFVTLHKKGSLRGCVGYILPVEKLYRAVINNAVSAALCAIEQLADVICPWILLAALASHNGAPI